MTNRISRRDLACALLATSVLSSPAFAQLAPPAPIHQTVDANGVDLFNGTLDVQGPALTMGQAGAQGIQFFKLSRNGGWTDNMIAGLDLEGSTMTATFAGYTDTFTVYGSSYANNQANGATLTLANGIYTYTRSDGTVVHFDSTKATPSPYYANAGRPIDIVSPSGAKLVFTYQSVRYCAAWKPGGSGDICTRNANLYRPTSVRNSYGYQLSFGYDGNYDYVYDDTQPEIQPDFYHWSQSIGVTGTNLAVATGASTRTQSWATVTDGSNSYFEVTDAMGRVTKYRMAGNYVSGVTLPGHTSEDETIGYTNGRVTSVATPTAGTTTYSSSDASGVRTVTVTDALSHVTTYKFNIASQTLTSVTDANGHTTSASYDSYGRITQITKPESNYTAWTYDGRGNVTEMRQVAKPGSGLSDIVTTANYDSSCANPVTCNQPNWTKDALGNETDYTYDATTGNLLTATLPAPTDDPNAVRPQTRYSYTSLQAYFKDASGSIVASGEPVSMLTGVSACQSSASCSGTSDEVKETIGYGPQVAGTGNNLLPVSASRGDGAGALTATATYGYDDVGNVISVDGPLSGADITRYRYDADREMTGAMDPDPDGSGAGTLNIRAVQLTYRPDGQVSKQELGTIAGDADPSWSTFSPVQTVDTGFYGPTAQPITELVSSGGTIYNYLHRDYDALGRVDCTAVRMNPAVFNSLPGACTPSTQGAYGPDQITKNIYDNVGQLMQVQVGVGTADAATERTLTYTANGLAQTLTDGENNKTTYVYDGFDRLSEIEYPSASKGSGTSNSSDNEQFGYDANGNVTSYTNRRDYPFQYSYDHLNRLTVKTVPDESWLSPDQTRDVYYGYDNLGRMTFARFDSTTGEGISNGWDALGRLTSSTTTLDGGTRTFTAQYDLAGNRTSLSGDGYSAGFTYDLLGHMTAYLEGGSSSAVRISYDDLGRRTKVADGVGSDSSTTSYAYDGLSRLTSLSHDLASSADDLTSTFSYSPSNQIQSQTRSNDEYAFTGKADENTDYTSNGLNQYTAMGSAAPTYDPDGNLTSDGTNSYAYTPENQLFYASGPTATTLYYDPLGRLWKTQSPTATNRLIYFGSELVREYDYNENPTHSYVHGANVDDLLVDYDDASGSTRQFAHADQLGSVVALVNDSGTPIARNAYDEYGNPRSGNLGRFQYTGQTWVPELAMYNYKARMYSPKLGRFLQADPIGTKDSPNLYQYTADDPINRRDPTGLIQNSGCSGFEACTVLAYSADGQLGYYINGPSPSELGSGKDPIIIMKIFVPLNFDLGAFNFRQMIEDAYPSLRMADTLFQNRCSLIPHVSGVKMISVSTSEGLGGGIVGKILNSGGFGTGIAIDPAGNVALPVFGSLGSGRGAVESVTMNYTTSTAQSLSAFGGLFSEAGGMGGIEVGGGLTKFAGQNGVTGTTYSAGEVAGAQIGGATSYTDIGPSINLNSALGCK